MPGKPHARRLGKRRCAVLDASLCEYRASSAYWYFLQSVVISFSLLVALSVCWSNLREEQIIASAAYHVGMRLDLVPLMLDFETKITHHDYDLRLRSCLVTQRRVLFQSLVTQRRVPVQILSIQCITNLHSHVHVLMNK
jgi:hypothetical protein